jgi:hypothetical protein
MRLHTLALISALALSSASLLQAQTTQPGNTGTATGTGTAPTTPPTHPTERGTPSMTTPGNPGGASGRDANSDTEAKQTCKNLSSAEERATCMQHTKKSHMGSKSKSGKAGSTDASGADAGTNGSGTGYSRPDAKP